MVNLPRRSLLAMGVALGGAALLRAGRALGTDTVAGVSGAVDDEAFWARVAADYEVRPGIVNLENGNWGIMSRPVLDAYVEHTRRVNRDNSYFARREFHGEFLPIRAQVAEFLGAGEDEIVFTRNATESLKALIGGYRGLNPGDAVLFADLDYGAMQAAMRTLAARRSCAAVELAVPENTDRAGLIDFYRTALEEHPAVKLLLLTHISHRTGLMLPVRDIVALARERGVDVIVDAAHSWGQIPFTVEELGADFVGFNLHKWIGAPLGVGIAYIRGSRLAKIAVDSAASPGERDEIRGRVHTGTTNYAALLTVPDALAYHLRIGPERKAARLRYLRAQWVEPIRGRAEWEILTPDDDRLHGGITSLRHRALRSAADNRQLAQWLLGEHGLFTVHRDGVAAGACLRVTPALYNNPGHMQNLVAALDDFEARGPAVFDTA